MNRLTYKVNDAYYVKEPRHLNEDTWELVQKLGTLEDIEEELGISLPILFKALKNGIIAESDDEKDELDGWRMSIYFEQKCFVLHTFWGKFRIDFKDYGKSWWLKEDLKNE